MNKKTLDLLEFNKIAEKVAFYALSESGKRAILHEKPSSEYGDVVYSQQLTYEASLVVEKYLLSPIVAFDPIDEIIKKAEIGATLQMGELIKVARMIRAGRIARNTIISTAEDVSFLKNLVDNLHVDETLEKDINIAIVSENEMSDNASDKLKSIRRKIAATNVKLKEKLASYTRNNSISNYLQDNLVTIRNNRFVIPVKANFKSFVPGLIHDQSATGSTVFIEPFVVVELNNELHTLQAEEQAEIEFILSEFTKRVYSNSETLKLALDACTTLDAVFAKYSFSAKNKCLKPELNKNGEVLLENARHPLLDKNKVVPITVRVGQDFDVLLITGPNTGGKTVTLKTVGLFCIMTYFGLWLPCDRAIINTFDGIYCDIGDEQSIDNELSTFSSHMVNIRNITNRITQNSLILFDELGGGTDPVEGSALALGIIEFILENKAKSIITTHYNELKEYGLTTNRVVNGCMQFDAKTFAPTYKLIIGMPGTSNAISIASRLGLNKDIIEKAHTHLNPDKQEFENLLKNAERIRNESLKELETAKAEREELDRERVRITQEGKKLEQAMQKVKSGAIAETKRLVSSSMQKADEIIDRMKELMDKTDGGSYLEAKKLRKQLEGIEDEFNKEEDFTQYIPLDKNDIRTGNICIVKSLQTQGTILSSPDRKGYVQVRCGNITTKVKTEDLAVAKAEKEKPKPQIKQTPRERNTTTFLTELKVLGLTVDEAIGVIEPYLINMYENEGNKIIKIVHGKGTMALAKGLHRYFKSSPIVLEFRYGRYGEGDNGVTFVTVK